MPKAVVAAYTDHRHTRPNGVQKRRRRASRRAVVPHLQELDRAQPMADLRLGRASGVTGEIHYVDSGYNIIGMKREDAPDIDATKD